MKKIESKESEKIMTNHDLSTLKNNITFAAFSNPTTTAQSAYDVIELLMFTEGVLKPELVAKVADTFPAAAEIYVETPCTALELSEALCI